MADHRNRLRSRHSPTPRQLLYALVAAALHIVVVVLIVAAIPLVPRWWTAFSGLFWLAAAVTGGLGWRRTALLLTLSIGTFVVWTLGTLLVRQTL